MIRIFNGFFLFGVFSLMAFSAFAQEAIVEDAVVEETQAAEETVVPYIANIAALRSFVDGVVKAHMDEDHIAGASVAIVQNNELLYNNVYGTANLAEFKPVSDDTLFRVGSISKTFIWTALMQLQQDGKLDINEPINKYLPEALQLSDDNFENPILIRHLMTHSLGLEDSAFGHLFVKDEANLTSISQYLENHRPEQVREAGLTTSYSNYGAALAGFIVEQVSGETFNDYVEGHIFTPLSMNNSSFREPYSARDDLPQPISAELAANISSGFKYSSGIFVQQNFEHIEHIAPAGAMSSTALDMARYMQAHLNLGVLKGGRILNQDSATTMQQQLFTNAANINGFAHGFMEFNLPGNYKGFGHGGATLYFMSNMVMVPELNLGIFISTNTNTGGKLVRSFPALLVDHFFAETSAEQYPQAPSDFKTRGLRFVGNYFSDRHSYEQLEKVFSLFNGFTNVSISKDGYLLTNSASGSQSWVETSPLTFSQVGGYKTLGFSQDEDGNIVKMFPNDGTAAATKVGFFKSGQWLQIIFMLTLLGSVGSLAGAWLRRKRTVQESLNESVASRLAAFMGFIWLLFFGFFITAILGIASIQEQVVFSFPSNNMVIALSLALFGLVLSLINLPSLFIVWRDGNWPFWRRIRHSLVIIFSFAFVLTLYHWNLLGFNYF